MFFILENNVRLFDKDFRAHLRKKRELQTPIQRKNEGNFLGLENGIRAHTLAPLHTCSLK